MLESPRSGSGLMETGQVSIPTTVGGTLLLAKRSGGSRSDVTFLNTDSTNTVYIGNTGLTTSNGFPLIAGASITRRFRGDIFAIASGGSVIVAYITDEDN